MAAVLSAAASLVHGNGVNGVNGHTDSGLKVLIVGAGIGGLSAGIGLRKNGHRVHLFEQSRFATETGAAIHIAPNANGVLKRLDVHTDQIGANVMERLTEYANTGEEKRSMSLAGPSKMWQHEWVLAHRVSLHNTLKKTASGASGEGTPVELHLSSAVVDVDPEKATVTLKDGTVIQGDVVIGADGVHSKCRAQVSGGDAKVFGSGKSAFRFLMDRKALLDDPQTKKYAERTGELVIWFGADRRVVMYPTNDNTLLNFVCIHPDSESEGGDDWDTNANKGKLLEVYKTFHPDCRAVINKADPESLKVWKLLDMPVLPTWVHGRLALLGDAAHPFLPHQGQGAAVAIEDAAALSVVLEKGLTRDEVPDRLKLFESIRYERANKIQEYSRLAGRDLTEDVKINMIEYTNYNFGHDEFDNATQKLREWKWAQTPHLYWRMPIAFGPMPGPRQDHRGVARRATESTFTTAAIKFKTSRTILQTLFPPGPYNQNYRFTSPGTVAYASFSQTTLNKMTWLGGSGYNHLGLYIHGVEYEKAGGETVSGTYLPVLFESLTDPIVSGREELGMPKLYSAIDVHRGPTTYRIHTAWQGTPWGHFRLEGLTPQPDLGAASGTVSGENDAGILAHRYMPAVGRDQKGHAEAEYPIFVPYAEDNPKPVVKRVWQADTATFTLDALDWEALPTLHHVVQRLAELPVYEIVSARVTEGEGVPDVGNARRID